MDCPPLKKVAYCSRMAELMLDHLEYAGNNGLKLARLTNGQIQVQTECFWRVHVPFACLPNGPVEIFIWEIEKKYHEYFFTVVNGKVFGRPFIGDLINIIVAELLESGIAIPL